MPTAEPRHYRCADADFPLPALPWGDEATSLEPAGLTASGRAQPRPDLAPPPASETMTAAAAPRGAHCSSHPSRERHSLSAAASGEALGRPCRHRTKKSRRGRLVLYASAPPAQTTPA